MEEDIICDEDVAWVEAMRKDNRCLYDRSKLSGKGDRRPLYWQISITLALIT